jgi:hypothetical protein
MNCFYIPEDDILHSQSREKLKSYISIPEFPGILWNLKFVRFEVFRFLQEPHGVTTQKTPFFNLKFIYGIYKNSPFVPILSQTSRVHHATLFLKDPS